jgi:hypothetical protein
MVFCIFDPATRHLVIYIIRLYLPIPDKVIRPNAVSVIVHNSYICNEPGDGEHKIGKDWQIHQASGTESLSALEFLALRGLERIHRLPL